MKVATKAPRRLTSVLVHSHQNSLGRPATVSCAAFLRPATDMGSPRGDVRVRNERRPVLRKWPGDGPNITKRDSPVATQLTPPVNRRVPAAPPARVPVRPLAGRAAAARVRLRSDPWPTHRTS